MTAKSKKQKREEIAELRRLLVLGMPHNEIMRQMNLPYQTFWKVMNRLMVEDESKMLEQQHHGLAAAITITKERFQRAAINLEGMAKNKDNNPRDRIDAQNAAVAVYNLILKLEGEQAIIASSTNTQILNVEGQIKQLETRKSRSIINDIEPIAISDKYGQQRPDYDTTNGNDTDSTSVSQRVFA